ncbi:MAG: response regulator [Candidatus Rokubacteria bacterium]|nr:response regulator [Candidatus Rokubacteria bacterium]
MSEAGGEPLTALIVDDDPAMRALLRDWLEREGFRVLEEPSGERLLALAQGTRFDVVILDKEMPGLGGFDVLPAFRRQRSEVPVILVTAFGGALVAEEALKLGARQYLEKPFQFRALIAAVRAATVAAAPRGDAEETERRAQP